MAIVLRKAASAPGFVAGKNYWYGRAAAPVVDVAEVKNELSGEQGTQSERMHLTHRGQKISAWHDIPFRPKVGEKEVQQGDVFNFVCEMPMGCYIKVSFGKHVARKKSLEPRIRF